MDEAGQARSWNLELRAPKAAFTLVELLVAVAVIAILAALLLPALGRAKQQAQGVYCLNSGHSLMLALSPNCCRRIIARLRSPTSSISRAGFQDGCPVARAAAVMGA